MKILFVWLGFVSCSAYASLATEWNYSNASAQASKGNYVRARDILQPMVIDQPDRPDLLYDLGVVSHKNKEFEQAAAYFAAATQAECPDALKEQAYFNLGNASVELNQLNDATVQYEKVLELNEANERAKHNLEVVKKMLEEQEQQKQQENQQDEQKDQDKQKDNESNNQDKNEQQDNQNQEGNNQKDQQKNESSQDGEQQDESGNQDQNKDANQSNKEKKEQGKKDQRDNKAQERPQNNRSEQQKKKESLDRSAKKEEQHQKNQQSAEAKQNEGPKLAPEDQWILKVLDKREHDEKKAAKEVMQASIDKNLGGYRGQHNW